MGDTYVNDDNQIFEPLKKYKLTFKDQHNETVNNYFEELKEKSQIDIAANKKTVTEIKRLEKEISLTSKKSRNLSIWRLIFIILGVIAIVAAAVGIYSLTQQLADKTPFILLVVFGSLILVATIVVNIFVLKPKIAKLMEAQKVLEEQLTKQKNIAYEQMHPLNELFAVEMAPMLFQKTIPLIKIDPLFDSRRLDYLVRKFGLETPHSKDRSTLFVKSGEMEGNPFYFSQDLNHRLGEKTYSGSKTITWTTTSIVNGKTVTRTHTQVLTATLNKPYPYYSEKTYLVYGNEAAPNLSFHRSDSDAEIMSDKQIDRHVKKDIKKLEKKSAKSVAKGGTYTVFGNAEFEVLFRAINRDHETQFRLLFTPLAQRQLLELMKDKQIAFGDDFAFIKQKKINTIIPDHLQTFNFNISAAYFHGYDYEQIRKTFIDYQNAYLKHVYFSFAPLLSIPLYQQYKTQEFIYKDLYDSYVSFYEHEKIINNMNATSFKHPLSQTRNIFKTTLVKSGEGSDIVSVTAYGYKTEDRVDYVTKMGGDGKLHRITIPWVEYIPVEKDSVVEIKAVSEAEEEKTYTEKIKEAIESMQKDRKIDPSLYVMGRLIARVLK